jgi:chromosome segregation ATPase
VTGLNPDQRYNVRVIAANSQNFQAPGQLIRLRTRQKSQCSTESAQKGDSSDDSPFIHSTLDVPPSPHNHHQHNNRRTTRERRGSPATLEQSHNLLGQATEDQHTVESLTRDLDAVRKEIHDLESQLAHTEDEYKTTEAVLRAELDTLRDKKNEEDAGRQRLRADAKALEEARRTAESARTRTEKALRAKEHEIKKMQDDMTKWEEEKLAALEKVDELTAAARESRENAVTTEKELSSDIQETQKQIAEMEEEIRSLVATMKTLESQKEQLKADEDKEANKAKEDNEKERMWKERQRTLEMRYVTVYNAFQMVGLTSPVLI